MKNRILYVLWGVLFAVCAALGFLPAPEGALKVLCVVLSVVFFVPPMLLVHSGDRRNTALVRNLAVLALVLALVMLVVNILSASASETIGTVLYYMLIIVTSPMICSRYWVLTLFLWAYLMIYSGKKLAGKR